MTEFNRVQRAEHILLIVIDMFSKGESISGGTVFRKVIGRKGCGFANVGRYMKFLTDIGVIEWESRATRKHPSKIKGIKSDIFFRMKEDMQLLEERIKKTIP